MTTVTGLTADRMLAIEGASVVDGDVDDNGNLILTKHDGSKINAGSVIGPAGPRGPVGQDTSVIASRAVLDVGLANQIRAGRQLSPADFGNLGLNAPIGLWNLSDLSDASGNGRNLLNKGSVGLASGINGAANTAAQFSAVTSQVLYISDTGANDPFRIRTGSIGCWFRTARRSLNGILMSKISQAAGNYGWQLWVASSNQVAACIWPDGSNGTNTIGVSDPCDDRWHFIVFTFDGSACRLYMDCVLETVTASTGPAFGSSSPLNIGGASGDGSAATGTPFGGRIDEAFVTADVLSEDQIRNLYCAKIAHTLPATPIRVSLNVRRRKKGAALVASDFSTQPLRLYNFSAGSLNDEGSNAANLADTSGVGGSAVVAGVDGSSKNAYSFIGGSTAGLIATDAGLPAALTSRSYGCWVKTNPVGSFMGLLNWGTLSTGEARIDFSNSPPYNIRLISNGDVITGPGISDGVWHFVVGVEDNGAADGIKRKLYIDGRVVGISVTMNPITLAGANHFRVGALVDGSQPFTGQIDTAFVCGYALTSEQILALYAKGSQALAASPKNSGDHIEAMDATNLYATFDTLESQYQVDLAVA